MSKTPYIMFIMFYLIFTFLMAFLLSSFHISETRDNYEFNKLKNSTNIIDGIGVIVTNSYAQNQLPSSLYILSMIWYIFTFTAVICGFLILYPFG